MTAATGAAGFVRHVVASSAPGRVARLTALDAAVRSPLPLATRVGVVGVAGGVGCSVVAGLLASTLASRRGGRVLAVNASAGGRSLLWHAGCGTVAPSTPEQDAARVAATTRGDAVAGLVATPAGVHGLELAQDGGPVPDAHWWTGVGPAARFFDAVVTDAGARSVTTAAAVAAASSVACVVADAERSSWQHGADLVAALEATGVPAVLAVSAGRHRAPAWCATAARLSPVPTVVLPHDRAHGAAAPVAGPGLRPGTARAALALAAAVVTAARPGRAGGRRAA